MITITFFSFIRDLIKSLLTPLPLFWLLLISGLVFYMVGKKKIARWFLGSSLLWFLLISTPFLPKVLLATLENQYLPVQLPLEKGDQAPAQDSIVHILVLGSGYETDNRLSFCGQLNLTGLARLAEGIRLQRLLPASKLIFSGYAGHQPLPQAEVSVLAAQELGIESTVISTISEPWNTRTEAEEYLKHFGTAYKLFTSSQMQPICHEPSCTFATQGYNQFLPLRILLSEKIIYQVVTQIIFLHLVTFVTWKL